MYTDGKLTLEYWILPVKAEIYFVQGQRGVNPVFNNELMKDLLALNR